MLAYIQSLAVDKFSAAFNNRLLLLDCDDADLNILVHTFNSNCSVVLDEIAPLKSRTIHTHLLF